MSTENDMGINYNWYYYYCLTKDNNMSNMLIRIVEKNI